jgi:hypothetical protein
MKRIALLLMVLMLSPVMGVLAQTNTPTPTPTSTPQPSPSYTAFPTWQWATLTQIPALSLTPRRLFTPTAPPLGEPFQPRQWGTYYPTSVPEPGSLTSITTINDEAAIWLTLNIVMNAVALWVWFGTNHRNILLTFRIILILVILIVAGSKLMKTVRQWEERRR